MTKATQALDNDLSMLAEDARALMAATADVAGEKVVEARRRLASALEGGRELCERVRDKTVETARAADETVRENPYQTIGITLGVGLLIGYLIGSRCSRGE